MRIEITDGSWFKVCPSLEVAIENVEADPSLWLIINGREYVRKN